jgi:hypothetical protein
MAVGRKQTSRWCREIAGRWGQADCQSAAGFGNLPHDKIVAAREAWDEL